MIIPSLRGWSLKLRRSEFCIDGPRTRVEETLRSDGRPREEGSKNEEKEKESQEGEVRIAKDEFSQRNRDE